MKVISVIIPTRNRASLLQKTLESLLSQTYPQDKFEIIVVDDGSTDNTRAVTQSFSNRIENLRYLYSNTPGLHEGRHLGLNAATTEILTYSDDDIEALPSWLEGISESFQDPAVGLVGGKNIPNYESPPPGWLDAFWVTPPEGKYMTYFSLLDFGDKIKDIDPHYVFGCNFSVRRSIVLDAGGFHPDGMPPSMIKYRGDGETHVAMHAAKAGFKAIYNPKASVKHWVPSSRMNMEYMLKRAYAEGITQSYIDTRRQHTTPNQGIRTPGVLSRMKAHLRDLLRSGHEKQVRSSFLDGYAYHQAELAKDKELLTWVLKDSYMTRPDNRLMP